MGDFEQKKLGRKTLKNGSEGFESKVCSCGKFLEINSLENFQWLAFNKISLQQWAMGDFEQKKLEEKL